MVKIVYYEEREGDVWTPWPKTHADNISEALLEHKRVNRPVLANHIWIEGIQVHALALGDGRIWDVINQYRPNSDWRKWDWNYNPNTDMVIDPGSGTQDWRTCKMPEPQANKSSQDYWDAACDAVQVCPKASELVTPYIVCPKCGAAAKYHLADYTYHCTDCGWVK